jgi:hypothetical protein
MRSRRCTTLVLIALVVMALAPAANAAVDYSKNAAGGNYAPSVSTPAVDYGMNAAGGRYAPAVTSAVSPMPAGPAPSADDGFAWGAAAIGAGAALAVVLLVMGGRGAAGTLRARREPV